INLQPLVLISAANNTRAEFATGIKVGQVMLEEDSGGVADILQDAITQLDAFAPPKLADLPDVDLATPPTSGQVLAYDSGDQKWKAAAGGGSNLNVVVKTANATLTTNENVVLADTTSGNITLTLPSVSGNTGVVFHIKKTVTANTLTIAASGSDTIDG